MDRKEIDAVEMTRRIRDAHAEQLENASPAERIQFFRDEARQVHERIGRRVPGVGPVPVREG